VVLTFATEPHELQMTFDISGPIDPSLPQVTVKFFMIFPDSQDAP